jgi:hypothetical protein
MTDEQTQEQEQDQNEREYEAPTLTVLGTVRELTSHSESEVPK